MLEDVQRSSKDVAVLWQHSILPVSMCFFGLSSFGMQLSFHGTGNSACTNQLAIGHAENVQTWEFIIDLLYPAHLATVACTRLICLGRLLTDIPLVALPC